MGGASAPLPVVSVVVPAHDYGRYLPAAIASIRAQTFEYWECIVVDDGSTDDTPAVLARLATEDDRIRVLRQPHCGLSAARNRALQIARGRYIQFLDADDLLHEAKLASHVEALAAGYDVDIVYGLTSYFNDGEPGVFRSSSRGPAGPGLEPMSGRGAEVLHHLLVRNQMSVAAPLVRQSVFESVGMFDEGLDRLEDWQFWLRCAIAGKCFLFVPSVTPVALIRVHGLSLSSRVVPMLLAEIPMRQHLQPALPSQAARDLNRRRLDEVSAEVGTLLALSGDVRGGLRHLLPAALSRRHPTWVAWVFASLLMPIPGIRRVMASLRERRRRRATVA